MNPQRVLQFEYQQSLTFLSDRPTWSELLEVSVRILSTAFSSGWYKEHFNSRGNDFVVLLSIAMHGRPLKGDDLKLLIDLGMAQPEDDGRLYARVTDLGLADELGMSAKTIQRCAERLQRQGAISILEIPDMTTTFRDSHGRFSGSKVYLLSGDLQGRFLEKNVSNSVQRTNSPTVEMSKSVQRTNCPTVDVSKIVQRTNCLAVESPENGLHVENCPAVEAHRGTIFQTHGQKWIQI